MTDDEARMKVAEYMGWTRCVHSRCPGWNVGGFHLDDEYGWFSDTPEGWWEFGQLVSAWKRDRIHVEIDETPKGWLVFLGMLADERFFEIDADPLPQAAYLATVKMLKARHN